MGLIRVAISAHAHFPGLPDLVGGPAVSHERPSIPGPLSRELEFRRIEFHPTLLEKRDRLRVVDVGRESLTPRELAPHVRLHQRRLARRAVELLPRDEQRERQCAREQRSQPQPTRPRAQFEPVDEFLGGARAGHQKIFPVTCP